MIKTITYDEIIKLIRSQLITQLKLKPKRVINAASVRGADLSKVMNDTDVMSINLNDVFMTFDLIENDNGDTYIIEEDDSSMSSLAAYRFLVHIYGNACHMCAQKLRALFKSQEVATILRDNGVYLQGISYPVDEKEFINNTLWPRCDIELEIEARHNFEKTTDAGYFSEQYDSDDIGLAITTEDDV